MKHLSIFLRHLSTLKWNHKMARQYNANPQPMFSHNYITAYSVYTECTSMYVHICIHVCMYVRATAQRAHVHL